MARSVSKWDLFEEQFVSTRTYQNPPQQARLTAEFVSPTGRTNRVHGYWEGGSRWAVRFSPNELGNWTFTTSCSDARNDGLQGRSGEFLCTVQSLRNDLGRHGKIHVPKGSFVFEHGDGTPFLWAGDGVWDGARLSTRKEWVEYLETRSRQGFTVAMWRAAPGADDRGKSCFQGTDAIELDTGMLGRLDEKIAWLNEGGMVSAIAPVWEIGLNDDELLPEDQVIVLLRQLMGRWDARHVAWIIAFEADTDGRRAARWRRIGRRVFDQFQHSPVILFCGSAHWALNEFASESWVNALAFESGDTVSEEAALWLARGPMTTLWTQQPSRPILNLLPATEAGRATDGSRITTGQATETIARSLFVAPPAGVCYQSRATADWDRTPDTNTLAVTGEPMAEWQKSLHLTGAKRVGQLRELVEQSEFNRLLPCSASLLLPMPAGRPAARPLSALATPRRSHALIYLPEGQTAFLPAAAFPANVTSTFFSLATGLRSPAVARPGEGSTRFSAPGPGDWLLSLAPPSLE